MHTTKVWQKNNNNTWANSTNTTIENFSTEVVEINASARSVNVISASCDFEL